MEEEAEDFQEMPHAVLAEEEEEWEDKETISMAGVAEEEEVAVVHPEEIPGNAYLEDGGEETMIRKMISYRQRIIRMVVILMQEIIMMEDLWDVVEEEVVVVVGEMEEGGLMKEGEEEVVVVEMVEEGGEEEMLVVVVEEEEEDETMESLVVGVIIMMIPTATNPRDHVSKINRTKTMQRRKIIIPRRKKRIIPSKVVMARGKVEDEAEEVEEALAVDDLVAGMGEAEEEEEGEDDLRVIHFIPIRTTTTTIKTRGYKKCNMVKEMAQEMLQRKLLLFRNHPSLLHRLGMQWLEEAEVAEVVEEGVGVDLEEVEVQEGGDGRKWQKRFRPRLGSVLVQWMKDCLPKGRWMERHSLSLNV